MLHKLCLKSTCFFSSLKALIRARPWRWLLPPSFCKSVKRRATAYFSSHGVLRMVLELPFIFLPTEILNISCNFNTELSKEVIILCVPFCTLVNTTWCSVWVRTQHLNHNGHHSKNWMGLTRQYLRERLETYKGKTTLIWHTSMSLTWVSWLKQGQSTQFKYRKSQENHEQDLGHCL